MASTYFQAVILQRVGQRIISDLREDLFTHIESLAHEPVSYTHLYWQDEDVQKRLGDWMRAAVGVAVSRELKVMRFGDNMREVAVTEGDKVEDVYKRQLSLYT